MAVPMSAAAEDEPGAPATPRPRSPPGYPDLCGRHRLQVEIQLLSREVAFLQEELQMVEGLQSVSICCKEVNEYVGANPDPFIPVIMKKDKSCCIWRWIRAILCFNIMRICCSSGCCPRSKRPSCVCKSCDGGRCLHCDHGCCCCCCCSCSSSSSSCCKFFSRLHCVLPRLSCTKYSCGCVCFSSKCTETCCLCSRSSCCTGRCLCHWPSL